jgi:transmembrane sensor
MPLDWFADRAGREADEWIAKTRRSLTAAERIRFNRWRSKPRNAAAFNRALQLWGDTGGATRTHAVEGETPTSVRSPGRRQIALAGGAAFAAALLGVAWQELRHGPAPIDHALYAATSARTIRLADGSTVDLGDDSLISTDFDGQKRALTLIHGHARFAVAHDAAHPFVVTAGDRQIIARGTAFEVTLDPHGVTVAMFQGVVDVRHVEDAGPTEPVLTLHKGDRLQVVGSTERVRHDAVDGTARQDWRDYAATPLGDVIRDVNQHRPQPAPRIVIDNASIAMLKVDGKFDLANPPATARQLATAFDLEVRESGNALILSMRHQAPK